MLSLLTHYEGRHKLAENFRLQRVQKGLTQAGLAKRSGVSLGSVRRFEQQAQISLDSLFKLAMVLGLVEKLVEASTPTETQYQSIQDVIRANEQTSESPKQRGHKT